jgi:hypothetical protein
MPSIDTLIIDVEHLVKTRGWFSDEIKTEFGDEVARRLQERFNRTDHKRALRLSALGPKCPKQLWLSVNKPELAEPLPARAEIMFTYGDLIEAMAITLAKAAGHTVEGEQDEVFVDGVSGHRDCIIDGCLVDVKSAGKYLMERFKDGSIKDNDDFGYLAQLDGYLVGSLNDPILKVKDRAYDWAIDKQLGKMFLYEHKLREDFIRRRIADYRRIVSLPTAPACACGVVADGKSGNLRLDTKASYSSYRYECHPHLRTFLYSTGPVYLTKVVRKPDVTEVDRHGQLVYN